MWRYFHANTSCHAMTLTFEPLTLKVCGRSGGTWSQSVLNLIEIEQSPAELFKIWQIFARVTSRCDLDLWPWTFMVVRASCVQILCKIWAKSNNPLQSYWRFSYLFPRGGVFPNSTPQRGVDRYGSDTLVRFEMTAAQKWAMSKSWPNFTHFNPL